MHRTESLVLIANNPWSIKMLMKKLSVAALVLAGLSANVFAQTPKTPPAHTSNPVVAADKAQLQTDHAKVQADVAKIKVDKAAGDKTAVSADKAQIKADLATMKADQAKLQADRAAAKATTAASAPK